MYFAPSVSLCRNIAEAQRIVWQKFISEESMELSTVDHNFAEKTLEQSNWDTYPLPCAPFRLYGAVFDDTFGITKIPATDAAPMSDAVRWGARCTDGVRLVFATDSKHLALEVEAYQPMCTSTAPYAASSGFSLSEVAEGKYYHVGNITPDRGMAEPYRYEKGLDLAGGELHIYVLFFPTYSGVRSLTVKLDRGAKVAPANIYRRKLPIVYYGSSITQGACASRCDNMYQAYVSERFGLDFMSFGFSGNALAEDAVVEYLSRVPASVFVCDYDYNAPDAEYLEKTHRNLYLHYRKHHPKTPIVFMSAPNGSRSFGSEERAKIIRETCLFARRNGDSNVYFLNGDRYFPSEVKEHCQIDGVHPTDLGFYFMYKTLARTVFRILGKSE